MGNYQLPINTSKTFHFNNTADRQTNTARAALTLVPSMASVLLPLAARVHYVRSFEFIFLSPVISPKPSGHRLTGSTIGNAAS